MTLPSPEKHELQYVFLQNWICTKCLNSGQVEQAEKNHITLDRVSEAHRQVAPLCAEVFGTGYLRLP